MPALPVMQFKISSLSTVQAEGRGEKMGGSRLLATLLGRQREK